jgi:ABC-type dipeptide/oligopeptide/nickel transport system permease subunit
MKMYVYIYYSKGPLQIIIALVLLYQQMQWSIIPGIALLILMIPINLFLQSIQKKLTV